MLSIQIDDTGDIMLDDKGNPIPISGIAETKQEVEVYLQTNKNEWFLDPDLGINHADFRGKKPNNDVMRMDIMDGLEQTERFKELVSIDFERDMSTRKLSVSFRAIMTDGINNEGVVDLDVG